MDNFNNFFDNQNGDSNNNTPIYHTPTPNNTSSPSPKKTNVLAIVGFSIAAIMCIIVIVNVIVLATLKSNITEQLTASMEESLKDLYEEAINDAIADKDIASDVVDQIKDSVTASIGEVAETKTVSTAVIKAQSSSYNYLDTYGNLKQKTVTGTATGFLITETDIENGITTRYLATNAHVVLYENPQYTLQQGGIFGSSSYRASGYAFTLFDTITCTFENDNLTYNLRVVAYGSYPSEYDGSATKNSSQSDLAICEFVGTQPSNTAHPALTIAESDYTKRGADVAIIGNPEGYGISISTGIVSQKDMQFSNWASGTFIMTNAAINGGNSGGPMLDKHGVVIGVVESKLVSSDIENMGFAVSASTLINFISWAQNSSNNELGKALNFNIKTAPAA